MANKPQKSLKELKKAACVNRIKNSGDALTLEVSYENWLWHKGNTNLISL
jgi:hypothetical protein